MANGTDPRRTASFDEECEDEMAPVRAPRRGPGPGGVAQEAPAAEALPPAPRPSHSSHHCFRRPCGVFSSSRGAGLRKMHPPESRRYATTGAIIILVIGVVTISLHCVWNAPTLAGSIGCMSWAGRDKVRLLVVSSLFCLSCAYLLWLYSGLSTVPFYVPFSVPFFCAFLCLCLSRIAVPVLVP